MEITREFLREKGACPDGFRWFCERYDDSAAVDYAALQRALRVDDRYDWSAWLTERVWRHVIAQPAEIAALAQAEVDDAIAATAGSPSSSSGYASRAASSGYGSTAASSGNGSTAASSGYGSKAASSGDGSKAASSGDYSKAASSGEAPIAMVAGQNGRAKAGPNGCVALVWHDGQRNRIAVGYVGEDGIKADTWYRLDAAGRFVEADV